MDNLYILLGQGLLTLLSCYVCYLLGKRTERNAEYNRKTDALRNANAARASLRNPDVVERLRNKYKR